MSRNASRTLLTLTIVGFVALAPIGAGSVNVLWNPSSGATGYRLHSGSSSGSYGAPTTLGNVTQTTVNSMADCQPTYFAVTAFNSAGESGFSGEISTWPRPSLGPANPSQAQRGQQVSVVISGNNFQPGVSVQFANPGITVNSVTRNACNQVTAAITIGSSTALGPVQVSAVNPNGVTGVAPGLFSIVTAPLPDVENLRRTDTQ